MTTLDENGFTEFRFFRPTATEVALAGDFNEWSCQMPMRRDAQGWWSLRLKLEAGDYRFRYVADGKWFTDYASNGVEMTKTGWNSLLVIPGLSKSGQPRHRINFGTSDTMPAWPEAIPYTTAAAVV